MKAKDIQVGAKLVRVLFEEDGEGGFLHEKFYDVTKVERGPSAVYSVTIHPEGTPARHQYRYTGVEVAMEFEVMGSAGHGDRRRAVLNEAVREAQQELEDRMSRIADIQVQLKREGQT
jgi:hypothetical protein